MEHALSSFSLNRHERSLTTVLLLGGWALIVLAVVSALIPSVFHTSAFMGGLKVAGTGMTGLLLLLASAGIRQNRIVLELSCFFVALVGLGWLIHGLILFYPGSLVVGVVLLGFFGLLLYLRHRSIGERFQPRFFSHRQFETMTQIADTMIQTHGEAVLHPIQVAINVDRLMDEIESDVKREVKTVLILVEWVLPFLTFRPFPFSNLGSHARREVIARVIGAKGLFRDVARTLKLLSCTGYYGSPEGMAQVGFVPFEERPRSQAIDLTPLIHPDPHPIEDSLP